MNDPQAVSAVAVLICLGAKFLLSFALAPYGYILINKRFSGEKRDLARDRVLGFAAILVSLALLSVGTNELERSPAGLFQSDPTWIVSAMGILWCTSFIKGIILNRRLNASSWFYFEKAAIVFISVLFCTWLALMDHKVDWYDGPIALGLLAWLCIQWVTVSKHWKRRSV